MLLINIEIYDDRVSNVRWKWIMNKINHMKYEKKAILFSQQQKEKKKLHSTIEYHRCKNHRNGNVLVYLEKEIQKDSHIHLHRNRSHLNPK